METKTVGIVPAHSDEVDLETGLPKDYESLFTHYHSLAKSLARKAGIHEDDIEDVANALELRFWKNDGLRWYDPEKQSKFSAMYWQWLKLSLMGERSKILKYRERFLVAEETPRLNVSNSKNVSIETSLWVVDARREVAKSGDAELIRALEVCIEAAIDGRQPHIKDFGMKSHTANKNLFARLQRFLTTHGLGKDSVLNG